MLDVVELEVVLAELGDMHQAFDVDRVEGDENAEGGHCRNGAFELLADALLHEEALEPVLDVARRLVGTALGARAVQADVVPAADRLVFFLGEHGLDGAVHEQVGIAPDRRGEVGVMLVGKAEVADVVGAVHGLAQ